MINEKARIRIVDVSEMRNQWKGKIKREEADFVNGGTERRKSGSRRGNKRT